jgi:hypothetical protein
MGHGFQGVMPKITTDILSPFSYNPEAVISLGYAAEVKIRERPEPLKRWMKC